MSRVFNLYHYQRASPLEDFHVWFYNQWIREWSIAVSGRSGFANRSPARVF